MTQVTPADRQALLNLILEVSFERKEVTLASGKKSNFYLDLRQTLMRPKGVSLAGRLVLDMLQSGPPVDAVGGMAVGAVPLVSAVLAAAANDPATDSLLGFFVRKQKKEHGLTKQIEGGFSTGQTVALVEDTTTTGGSTLDAVDLVEAAGGKVARVICLVDRGEGASEAFAKRGVSLEAVFRREDLAI
ncbi:MAG: orotate phosphoribosyltransferase [Myxococcales bacterium]|nr:orotate phosphoribosyltransferase [Myxococcales bacterium]HIK85839.1 orotate phosphoribosyltransferase [Myxococcales bacterium]